MLSLVLYYVKCFENTLSFLKKINISSEFTSNTLVLKIKDKKETPGELIKTHCRVSALPPPKLIRKVALCAPGRGPFPKTQLYWHLDLELLASRCVQFPAFGSQLHRPAAKEELLPFAVAGRTLKVLGHVKHVTWSMTNTLWLCLYAESKNTKQINKQNENKFTDTRNRLAATRGDRVWGSKK